MIPHIDVSRFSNWTQAARASSSQVLILETFATATNDSPTSSSTKSVTVNSHLSILPNKTEQQDGKG
jgi:hypothetical protein